MGRRLIRSKARDNWRVPGAEHQIRALYGECEYDELLKAKLFEESTEVMLCDGLGEVLDECADVLEVIRAIARVNGYTLDNVISRADAKAEVQGDFSSSALVWDTDSKS